MGDGIYKAADTVNITADAAPAGKVFDKWTGDNANVADVNSANTAITISGQTSLTALYKNTAGANQAPQLSFVTPVNGVSLNEGANLYVNVSASDPDGSVASVQLYLNGQFVRQENVSLYEWESPTHIDPLLHNMAAGYYTLKAVATDNEGLKSETSINISVKTAVSTFSLQVNNGSGIGDYMEGAIVTINADAAPAGKEFDKWTGDVANVADINSAATTLNMPAANIAVTATYKDLPTNQAPQLSFVSPTNGVFLGEGVNLYVNISASDPDGTVANVQLYLNGQFVRQENVSLYEWESPTHTDPLLHNMAAGYYTLKAVATDNKGQKSESSINISVNAISASFTLIVNSGSGGGDYESGSVVRIIADTAPEGKEFDQWIGDMENLADIYSANTTVTIPKQDVIITATYRDIPEDMVLAKWNFGEGSGDKIIDVSNHGYDLDWRSGEIMGSSIKGKIGNALLFDGSYDHGSNALLLADMPTEFSFIGWVKPDATGMSKTQCFLHKTNVFVNDQMFAQFKMTGEETPGEIVFSFRKGSAALPALHSGITWQDDTWYHYAVTWSTTEVKLFINGKLRAKKAVDGTFASGTYDNFTIGSAGTSLQFFKGIIDDITVYEKVLTDAEIQAKYQAAP